MKIEEILALSNEELVRQLEESQKEFFEIRVRLSTKQLVNHREVRRIKKKIARLKTIMRERELGLR
ncbi:50S ribosomal protein L29 [Chloroflexota bacterium]